MKLNDQQEIAANHRDGPCIVTACPGSGKTRVIIERLHRMIESGISPQSILSITFTNKAASEMKERAIKRVGDEIGKKLFISTFHRLCSTIIRYYGFHLGYDKNMTILDSDEQIDLISQIARQKELELTKPQVKQIAWQINEAREKLETIGDIQERFDAIDERFYDVADLYLKKLLQSNVIDFTGLLSEAHRLLIEHPSVVEAAQKRWKYGMVDETQDTNLVQFKLVEILFSHTKNVFIVGDTDQSIYSWRGARIENIRDFQKTFPGTKIISLGKNYRSTPQIIAAADKLIRHNPDRIEVEFSTDNPPGQPISVRSYGTDLQEADQAAKFIKAVVGRGQFQYKDVAIFYRLNSMSRAAEMAMISNGIPHTVIGNFSFFDRKEIKDSMAMLRFITNPKDGLAFHRFANKPRRSLGDTTIGKIEIFAEQNNVNIIEALKTMPVTAKGVKAGIADLLAAFDFEVEKLSIGEVLNHLVTKLNYKEYLENEDADSWEDRWENIQELIRDATRYSVENGPSIAKYLEQVALITSSDKTADGNAVSLMSLHASKGLEFPVVFMLGCEQNILPHKRAVEERADGLDEERRLCYVGMTRAKQVLCMSYCQRRQEGFAAAKGRLSYKDVLPSQFLYESGLVERPAKKEPERSVYAHQEHY